MSWKAGTGQSECPLWKLMLYNFVAPWIKYALRAGGREKKIEAKIDLTTTGSLLTEWEFLFSSPTIITFLLHLQNMTNVSQAIT